MFTSQKITRLVSQKQRNRLHGGSNLLFSGGTGMLSFQYNLCAITSGFLHPRCLESIYIYARKLIHMPQKSAKIWMNVQACRLVSKKALNVRMGKGKGSRQGFNARIAAGTCVVGLNFCRLGIWKKLCRFVRARCSFRVCSSSVYERKFTIIHGHRVTQSVHNGGQRRNSGFAILQRRYITSKILEIFVTLQRLGRLRSYIYFRSLFSHYRHTVPQVGYQNRYSGGGDHLTWVGRFNRVTTTKLLVKRLLGCVFLYFRGKSSRRRRLRRHM